MLGNKKNAFWEAFLIAGVVFILGLLLGLFVEQNRVQQVNDYFSEAETSLIDSVALSNSLDIGNNCQDLISTNIQFADSIYQQAVLLEQYEQAGKISDSIMIAHKKYDLLRTILWQNLIKINDKCPGKFNFVIYLYNYNPPGLNEKAVQNVWSKILYELKQKEGSNVVLVPISASSNLSSLNYLMKEFNVSDLPAVIINDKTVVYNLTSTADLEKYLIKPNAF